MPSISLDQEAYEGLENTSLHVAIRRSGDFSLPVTVSLTTLPVSGDNAALGTCFLNQGYKTSMS